MTLSNFLADNLQYLRKRKRLSQGELANALGLSRSQIASYEHDKAEPSVNKLAKIAVFFNVSLEQLLGENMRHETGHLQKTVEIPAGKSLNSPPGENATALPGFESRAARLHKVAEGLKAMHEIKKSNRQELPPEAISLQRELENLFDFTNSLMLFNEELIEYLKTTAQ